MLLSSFRDQRGRARRPGSAGAPAAGAAVTRRGAGSQLALRNWRVASRLILLVAIPTILGLAFAGLRVASATTSASVDGQVSRLAALGQQVTGLTQSLEAERDDAAAFIANGSSTVGLATLHRQYASTNSRAASVRRLVAQLDGAHPLAKTRTSAATALASIAELPALRRETAQSGAAALTVADGYSAAITSLFPVVDAIADQSGNSVLITSVRALGSLADLKDQVSQQQAVLGAALTEGKFEPGALTALAVAQAQEASDLTAFRSSATAEEGWALASTLSGSRARQATSVEQRAIAAGGGTLALGSQASQRWQSGTSYLIGWMRHAEQQLAGWIAADARAQQRGATRVAMVTGGVALAGLILALLLAFIIVRSVVRPLRWLESAALDAADSLRPDEVRAVTAGTDSWRTVPVPPAGDPPGAEIGQVAQAFDRLRAEAVRMAGEEARLRDADSVVVASFFRRSRALHDRLLRLIDSMELGEDDPERLARLFEADNLATQMRRHSDTALVLAGHETPRRWTEPVALVDVLRAAASEIEHYDRITLDVQPGVFVSGSAAVDTVHLLAELLENGTAFSPETAQVLVSGFMEAAGGALITITDSGTGVSADHLRWLNWQLAHPLEADETVAHQMGLFAVGQLAARHDISVLLTQPPPGGTTAAVHLPAEVISLGDRSIGEAGALGADYGRGGGAVSAAPDPLFLTPRFNSGPQTAGDDDSEDSNAGGGSAGGGLAGLEHSVGDESGAAGPQAALPDGSPLILSAPVQASPVQVSAPEPAGGAPGGSAPVFGSVEPDYAPAQDPAGAAWSRLTSFQEGSRRGRAAARLERDANQVGTDD